MMANETPLVADEAHLRPLAPGVWAFIGARGDSNAGAIETPDGLIVVDVQQHGGLARTFRDALARDVGKPIERVINTHYHLDHIAGNALFGAEAPILAHDRTAEKLVSILGPAVDGGWTVSDFTTKCQVLFGPNITELIPDGHAAWDWFRTRLGAPDYDTMRIVPPTETFAESYEIELPGEVVRLDYLGPAHCDGDLVVHLRAARIAFLGDLLFSGRFPWIGDCDVAGWIRALDWVCGLDVDCVVPGHGLLVTLKEVAGFRDLLRALLDAVAGAIRGGASEDAAAAEVELPGYAAMPRYREWMSWNVRNTYRGIGAS
jgi:glyoxylase-like metal-dependent hydrolase (beta-lactamase superfamily II)